MPRKTWAGLFVLLPLLLGALHFIVSEAIGAAALDAIIEHALGYFGLEKSRVSAVIAPFVIPGLIAVTCLFAAFKLGEYERTSFEPVADIDPRMVFQKILDNPKWQKQNEEKDTEKRRQLVRNYLEIRLDRQIHELLVQDKLRARGERNLRHGSGPADWIANSEWQTIEIVFDSPDAGRRAVARRRDQSGMAYVGVLLCSRQVAKQFRLRRRSLIK